MSSTAQPSHWMTLTARIAAALIGGYVFTWGFTSLVVALSLATHGDYDEGLILGYLLAFIVFLCAFLWAFAAPRPVKVWLVLAGGGAVMTIAASLLTQSLNLQH